MKSIYKSEQQKLLDLIKQIDPKAADHIEFTADEYVKLKNEINLLGGKIKLTIVPPPEEQQLMNKQTYNYLTRQGTPEDAKRIENNNKIELAQRRVNARKKYGLEVSEEDLAIINNGQIQTKKQFMENLPIHERPGYDPDKDNNLLRRLAYWGGLEGQNFGKEFDKAIAQEDLALKKLGEKQKNILQRNKKTEVKSPWCLSLKSRNLLQQTFH